MWIWRLQTPQLYDKLWVFVKFRDESNDSDDDDVHDDNNYDDGNVDNDGDDVDKIDDDYGDRVSNVDEEYDADVEVNIYIVSW